MGGGDFVFIILHGAADASTHVGQYALQARPFTMPKKFDKSVAAFTQSKVRPHTTNNNFMLALRI